MSCHKRSTINNNNNDNKENDTITNEKQKTEKQLPQQGRDLRFLLHVILCIVDSLIDC